MCLERAFSKGATAQKALNVVVSSKAPLAEWVFLRILQLQTSEMLVRFLLASPLSSRVNLAFFSKSLTWWGGLCGLGHSRPAASSFGALAIADDCTLQCGHLFQLAGDFGFQAMDQGSCLF